MTTLRRKERKKKWRDKIRTIIIEERENSFFLPADSDLGRLAYYYLPSSAIPSIPPEKFKNAENPIRAGLRTNIFVTPYMAIKPRKGVRVQLLYEELFRKNGIEDWELKKSFSRDKNTNAARKMWDEFADDRNYVDARLQDYIVWGNQLAAVFTNGVHPTLVDADCLKIADKLLGNDYQMKLHREDPASLYMNRKNFGLKLLRNGELAAVILPLWPGREMRKVLRDYSRETEEK